ncbi:MAG: hypothetical protein H7319_20440 [Spirosoma sp.]|nr:hypothetical protein [Spirosoma sp.]
MSRSLFLLLSGAYGILLFLAMVFATTPTLQNYGVPDVDLNHISIMQFLGVSTGALALLLVLNRNAPNTYTLRTLLLAQALYILAGVLLGVYHVYVLNVPNSTFFVVDSLFRLALGLGFLYFYNRETRQVGATVLN